MRSETGNDWMTENIVPHLADPTDRLVGETVVSFQRSLRLTDPRAGQVVAPSDTSTSLARPTGSHTPAMD